MKWGAAEQEFIKIDINFTLTKELLEFTENFNNAES